MQTKRQISLDFIKIISCCLIVALHTVNPDFGFANFIIFSIAATAIPFFLMVNGYLMFQKDTITYVYIGKKIFRILMVCFSWEMLHAAAYFMHYHEVRNFVKSFLLDFLQKGLFFHFWFMGTLIILYLLLPFLHRMYKKSETMYISILVGLGVICFIVSLVMVATKNQFVLEVPQSFRLWYWLFYYMLGGLLAKRKIQIQTLMTGCPSIAKIIVPIAAVFGLVAWQWLIGNIIMKQYVLETFYGSIPIMGAVTSLFLCMLRAKYKWEKTITYLSSLSMGIYIFHPFVLAVFQKFIPAFISGNVAMNLLFWIVTVIVCGIITAIVNMVPVIKELIRL